MAPSDFLHYLEDCVSTTEHCGQTLQRTNDILQAGVSDLPRLCKVLHNHHRFLVLPETTVHTHKAALAHHLTPQIENLIAKAESSVEAQRAKIKRLEEKLSILEDARGGSRGLDDGPMPVQAGVADDVGEEQSMDSQLDNVDMKGLDAAQRKRMIMLKGKRRRLEAERQALGL